MLKKLLKCSLALLIISSSLHLELHDHEVSEGYGFCDIDCKNRNHRKELEDCQQCLSKKTRSVLVHVDDIFFGENKLTYIPLYQNFDKDYSSYYLYGRPPPHFTFV